MVDRFLLWMENQCRRAVLNEKADWLENKRRVRYSRQYGKILDRLAAHEKNRKGF